MRHWAVLVAADFLSIEIWTRKGLTRYIVLFLMDLSTRRVHIAGMASRANGLWMAQVARNLTDDVDGFLRGKRYLIHDRDPLYTAEFLATLPTGNCELLEIMEFKRLAATLIRCVSCQLSSLFFGLLSAPVSPWNWRTLPSATRSTS